MNRISILLLILVSVIVVSCNKNRVYEEHNAIADYSWKKSNKVNFSVDIDDVTPKYNILVAVRFIYGFPLYNLNVKLSIETPSGKKDTASYVLPIRKANGEYYGEVLEDYGDVSIPVQENIVFEEKGTYKFELEHIEANDLVPFIMEMGLIIDKVDLNKK